MLIKGYRLEIQLSTHSVAELELEAAAWFDVDLSPVMPYLNAVLPGARYSPQIPALSWRYRGHKVGFWSDHIAVDHAHDEQEVRSVMDQLVALVNDIWDRRQEIQPQAEARTFLQPLEIYRLLPQTNCKLCGNTCYTFALKVAVGQVELQRCLPLFDDGAYRGERDQLEALLSSKSANV